jgi:hypothetical protein
MKKSNYNSSKEYSISKVLREEKRSNEYFEILLNNLTLEEIIALKLELGYKAVGFPLHGFPIWKSTNYIVKDALLKYAVSATESKREAVRFLGISPLLFFKLLKKYKIDAYFTKKEKQEYANNGNTIKENIS